MVIGMALIAISDVGTAFATSLGALVLARLGLGAGRCISESGERGMLADLVGRMPSLRGRALGLQQAVSALGIAVGAPLGGAVVEAYGPRASFLCVSAAAAASLLISTFLPETLPQRSAHHGGGAGEAKRREDSAIAASAVEQSGKDNKSVLGRGNWRQLLLDNKWRGLALCQASSSFGFACKIACIPVIASGVLPGGAAGAGALLSPGIRSPATRCA